MRCTEPADTLPLPLRYADTHWRQRRPAFPHPHRWAPLRRPKFRWPPPLRLAAVDAGNPVTVRRLHRRPSPWPHRGRRCASSWKRPALPSSHAFTATTTTCRRLRQCRRRRPTTCSIFNVSINLMFLSSPAPASWRHGARIHMLQFRFNSSSENFWFTDHHYLP